MQLSKKDAKKRWSDPAFQANAAALVSRMVSAPIALSDVDIAGISIGVEGPVKKLWHINLHQAKLHNVDMSYSDLRGSLNETELRHVRLVGAKLDRCLLKKAKVTECDFSNAKLIVNLDDAVFEGCRFIGTAFSATKSLAEFGGRRVRFTRCDFSDAVFKRVEFRATHFIDCTFDRTQFIQCDLRGAKVEGGVAPLASQFDKMDAPTWARPE
jgi:uncharacterized protein YjbI with pentapeptide repeats